MPDLSDLLRRDPRALDSRIEPAPSAPPTDPPASAADDWPPMQPFRGAEELPDWPRDIFHPDLEAYIDALALSLQVDRSMVGMLVLLTLAAAVGGRLQCKASADWIEWANLYGVVVALPGQRKSPVFSSVVDPIRTHQREVRRAWQEQSRARRAELAILRKQLKAAERSAQEGEGIEEATTLAQRIEDLDPGPSPLLLVDDVTPEALVRQLAEQGGVLSLFTAEGSGFFRNLEGRQRGQAPNLSAILKAWGGEPITTHRIQREGEDIEAARLTVALATQPGVIRDAKGVRQHSEQGLLDRFLVAYPRDTVGHRQIGAPSVPPAHLSRYRNRIADLCRMDGRVLSLDPNAARTFGRWQVDLEERMRAPGGSLCQPSIRGWASKAAGHTLRIAGLLQLATSPGSQQIDGAAVLSAVRVMEALIPHARFAFDGRSPDGLTLLLEVLQVHPEPEISARDLLQRVRHRIRTRGALLPLLAQLEAHHIIRPIDPRPGPRRAGRPPSQRFAIHPRLAETALDTLTIGF